MTATNARIIPFEARHAADFKRLNLEWLEKYFRVEPPDEEVLSHPEDIINSGGVVLMAELEGRIVGTCALIHEGHGHFELSKTAVTASAQGHGIGRKLVEAAIDEYHNRKGHELVLESNTALKAAVSLYEKLGFQHVPRPTPSPFERANVYMIYKPTVRSLA